MGRNGFHDCRLSVYGRVVRTAVGMLEAVLVVFDEVSAFILVHVLRGAAHNRRHCCLGVMLGWALGERAAVSAIRSKGSPVSCYGCSHESHFCFTCPVVMMSCWQRMGSLKRFKFQHAVNSSEGGCVKEGWSGLEVGG
jgi:hypothetical protein